MKRLLFVVVLLVASVNAHAQVKKCTAPDGKVTYSDILCNSSSTTMSIKNPDGNTVGNGGYQASTPSKCDVALKNYQEALARRPQYVNTAHLMPEYVAVNAICGQSTAGAQNSMTGDGKSGCESALNNYKEALASKPRSINTIHLMPESVAVNAKCGQGTIKAPENIKLTDQNGNTYRLKAH